ncbi:unnamed protein product (macronuclear) [Paramecium tetraurelia]|uniref:JAB1/MPN/MOV34 metalloenzyme domain-containing protein n=1 Tax=Paramecium tetraurelia TaxID=5888 RepID=A0CSM9_PARTE|nr:uncharacterized protein GSPATT00010068001 [Paramecium tetraurelia]CAK73796.1 unnamed protein product [Paramecium tetraurelia]|eukprot:XP_001441193.1 hypothetical protein (macronuclear) [Paramecium tetraurelia strain d4-2]
MQQTNVHPQVLLSISSQILTNKVNFPGKNIHAGILLGFFNAKINKTDILDSFEISYSGKGELKPGEIDFLKERQQLRLKGDKWNLFKNLDIVGWYITDSNPHEYLKVHKQLQTLSEAESTENQTSFFKYLLCFDPYSTQANLYEMEENKMQVSQSKVEPQSEEMIGITSLFSQQSSQSKKKYDLRVNSQLQMISFLETMLQKLLQQLDHPQIANDPLALLKINEVLISFPQINQQNIEQDYFKLLIISYYCAILKLDVTRNKQD